MLKYIIAFLLHHANRAIKDTDLAIDEFYAIKSKLLKKYGVHVNYDVQHIPGKRCNTCHNGVYIGYYEMSGEKWTDTCNRCWGSGWYKMPKWICLSRIKMGPYHFHQPLKREECARNPFTKEELGWEVSERPVIDGYIDHKVTRFGRPSILILFYIYDRNTYNQKCVKFLAVMRQDIKWWWIKLKKSLHWKRVFPEPKIMMFDLDENNNIEEFPW